MSKQPMYGKSVVSFGKLNNQLNLLATFALTVAAFMLHLSGYLHRCKYSITILTNSWGLYRLVVISGPTSWPTIAGSSRRFPPLRN